MTWNTDLEYQLKILTWNADLEYWLGILTWNTDMKYWHNWNTDLKTEIEFWEILKFIFRFSFPTQNCIF